MVHRLIRVMTVTSFALSLTAFAASSTQAQSTGEALFKSKCAMCHGPDGKGDVPMGKKLTVPNLASPVVQDQSDAQITEVVSKGKNKMPAYDSKLSKEQLSSLVSFVRELGKKH